MTLDEAFEKHSDNIELRRESLRIACEKNGLINSLNNGLGVYTIEFLKKVKKNPLIFQNHYGNASSEYINADDWEIAKEIKNDM